MRGGRHHHDPVDTGRVVIECLGCLDQIRAVLEDLVMEALLQLTLGLLPVLKREETKPSTVATTTPPSVSWAMKEGECQNVLPPTT